MKHTIGQEYIARELAEHIHKSESGGKKAKMNICGFTKLSDGVEEQCDECGIVCYRSKHCEQFLKKKFKCICGVCCLKNNKKELTPLQLEIMEKVYGHLK